MMGVVSVIPMDEVTEAMINVSAHMNEALRETAFGGLAVTPTGLNLRKKMGLPDVPEKYLNKCRSCPSSGKCK
jgi:hypothetical protein